MREATPPKPTVPSTISEEMLINPFMRVSILFCYNETNISLHYSLGWPIFSTSTRGTIRSCGNNEGSQGRKG